jgi:N6-adenosine-specific RNA methylase IME4
MPVSEIAALPVADLVADDCALFLWATWPTLPDAFEVMRAWGFSYRTCAFVWVKTAPRSAQEEARRTIQRGVASALVPVSSARGRLEKGILRGVRYCLRNYSALAEKYDFAGLEEVLANLRKVRSIGVTRQVMAGFDRGDLGGLFWGMGQSTRTNTEVCLIGVRGKLGRESGGVHQVVLAPPGRHSEKPGEVRDRIVQLLGDRPRIELFARQRAKGWHAWGNEVPGGSDIDLVAAARAARNASQLDLLDGGHWSEARDWLDRVMAKPWERKP